MKSKEVIITSSIGGQLGQIAIWDLNSTTPLLQMRDEDNAAARTMCTVRQEYVFVGIKGKPLLYRWTLSKGQRSKVLKTQVVPGHIGAIEISNDGAYLVAAVDEKMFLWQCNSGDLLAVLSDPNLQPITQLEFLDPPSLLVSASANGFISVWSMGSIRSLYASIVQPTVDPILTFSPCASLIHFTIVSVVRDNLIVTIGEQDGQMAVYSLNTGRQLEDSQVPSPCAGQPLFCITATLLGQRIFCGSSNGTLVSSSLVKKQTDYLRFTKNRILMENTDGEPPGDVKFLCLSPSGQALGCGTSCGHVVLVGLPDLLPYHRLQTGGSITNLSILWRPPWIEDIESFNPATVLIHPLRREQGINSSYSVIRGNINLRNMRHTEKRKATNWWSMPFREKRSSLDGPADTDDANDNKTEDNKLFMSPSEIESLQNEADKLRKVNRSLHKELLEAVCRKSK